MALVLITGTNRGIGLALCHLFAERGDEVIAVCREPSAALKALQVDVVDGIELTRPEDVARLKQKLGKRYLDVLINNAGVAVFDDTLAAPKFDDMERQFRVNAMAPVRVVSALEGNLGRGSKIALITSRMGSIADNGSGAYYGYRMSKAALNIAGMSMARDLAGKGVAVAILHPGFVRTDMTSGSGQVEPEESARGLMARIDALSLATSGSFWHANGETLPW
jgi:NAD(P)-dependent dehydrogenase (short-subunit alcohol dehydrogenase family)